MVDLCLWLEKQSQGPEIDEPVLNKPCPIIPLTALL